MQGKVEICGVNTARLNVLSQKDMDKLLLLAKDGDEDARQQLIEGNLKGNRGLTTSRGQHRVNPGFGEIKR